MQKFVLLRRLKEMSPGISQEDRQCAAGVRFVSPDYRDHRRHTNAKLAKRHATDPWLYYFPPGDHWPADGRITDKHSGNSLWLDPLLFLS